MKVDLSKNYHLLNGADLAYIGDAYYELEKVFHLLVLMHIKSFIMV